MEGYPGLSVVETDWIRLLKSPKILTTAVGSSLGENILTSLQKLMKQRAFRPNGKCKGVTELTS